MPDSPEIEAEEEFTEEEFLTLHDWLAKNFPHVVTHGMAPRHTRLWDWVESIAPGIKPKANIEVWPRGSGKSTTAELAVCRVGDKLSRKFALYVCATQDQAKKHVQAIANHFEDMGVGRALNVYGASRGWRQDTLRTAKGFSVQGIGLDVAVRGIKFDEFRPDFIVLDDIDNVGDTPRTIEKNATAIKSSILPAGSIDCAVLGIQNLIIPDGIFAQLSDGRAKFLLDRIINPIEVAVAGMEVEARDRGDGVKLWVITKGEATWEGQSIETCERQINEWELATFLREAQQEVEGADGYYFNEKAIEIIDGLPKNLDGWRFCRAWDIAGTEGGGDFTAGVLLARLPNGVVIIVDVIRVQYHSRKVRQLMRETAELDLNRYGKVTIRLPQDPGQAGVDQIDQLLELLSEFDVVAKVVRGKKSIRHRSWADKVNSGNTKMVRADWNKPFTEEHRKYREDEEHEFDDQVDAANDANDELAIGGGGGWGAAWGV